MRAEDLLHAAVANNAAWCETVCRSHGYTGEFTTRVWISARHALPFYPNAITLAPDATAAETGAGQDPARPYAVKDSFARLDLAPEGLRPLFDAEWIARPPAPAGPPEDGLCWAAVTSAGELAQWETAWAGGSPGPAPLFRPDLLAGSRCAVLAGRRDGTLAAGAIVYTSARVTGMSNVFGTGLAAGLLWISAVQAVAALRPGLPIVGYESGADLAAARQAGFQVLGPLRVWTRGPAP